MRRVRGIAALALLWLTGCGLELYGSAARYPDFADTGIDVVMPARAPHISQQFSARTEEGHPGHLGIDIYARQGAPILAAAPGRVLRTYYEPMYGRRVILDHGTDAEGRRVPTHYVHLDGWIVEEGARVARGQQIATMGRSGALAMMVHLHFEVRRGPTTPRAQPADPHLFWADGVGRVTCFDPARSYAPDEFVTTYPVPCK